MASSNVKSIVVVLSLLLAAFSAANGAEPKLGFTIRLESEGFILNPIVKKLTVAEVKKGSIAEAAGMKADDEIVAVEGQRVAGRRARELQPLMKLEAGQTRTLRVKHAAGAETDVRLTKPKA